MNSIFSVDDEIDFSDDDLQFNVSKDNLLIESNTTKEISIEDTGKENCTKVIEKSFSFNRMPPFSSALLTNSNSNSKFSKSSSHSSKIKESHLSDNDIFYDFMNDDTDELLSQIEMPTNEYVGKKQFASQFSTLETNDTVRNISLSESCKTKTFLQTSPSSSKLDNVIGFTEIHRKKLFCNPQKKSRQSVISAGTSEHNVFKNRTDLNITSCLPSNNTFRNVTPAASCFPLINSCGDVTPVNQTIFQVRSSKRKLSHTHENISVKAPSSRQRRFPGPAGSLPTLSDYGEQEKLKSPEPCKGKQTLTPLTPKTPVDTISNSQDDDFNGSIWSDVLKQVGSLFPDTNAEAIFYILERATKKQLDNGKVSLFCGLIKSFSISGSGGKLVLKDPSGEINGTVHKNVLDEFERDLRQGTGLILKDVSVYSPTLKKHYVNITPSNIVHILPADIGDMYSQSQTTQLENRNKDNISSFTQKGGINLDDISENLTHEKSCETTVNDKPAEIFRNEEDVDNFFEDELNAF